MATLTTETETAWKKVRINGKTLFVAKSDFGFWVSENPEKIGPFFVTLSDKKGGLKTCNCKSMARFREICPHIQAAQKYLTSQHQP